MPTRITGLRSCWWVIRIEPSPRRLGATGQNRNYNVVPVDRLFGAPAAAEEAYFDLLVSDIELPDGTGLELFHGRGGGRKLPGIAISGFGSEEDLQPSASARFAEHLTKPIDLNQMESAIRRVTSRTTSPPG